MFSLMWSEHCAYKHSKKLLRALPTEGPHLVMGPGENAGAVDVGDGLAIAFKVESHNHPSAVEPFQGAATGVGGILRDIFAVGARPIAVLDSLRFGELDSARSRYLLDRAVAGIGHYGNSIGVPTVGGEVYFEGPYEQNCLVNAMCLGLAPQERLIRSAAAGLGNAARAVRRARPAATGSAARRCSASAELGDDDADKRPTVQIGDPFEEKKLLECCLELLDRELLASLQDLGAAGLTSSLVGDGVQAARSGSTSTSRRCRCARPAWSRSRSWSPSRRSGCSASSSRSGWTRCSRSARAGRSACTAIGSVTDTRHLRVFDGDELVGDMPVDGARRRLPALRPRARAAGRADLPARRRATLEPSERPGGETCSRCSARRTSPRAGRCSSSTTASSSRAPCAARAGRRRGAPARPRTAAARRDRRLDRRQRPPRRLRPVPRHRRGGARVRGEPRLRRRRAARPDQLPELRQPREAAHRLAARPSRSRHGRRLPRARRAGRRRQRLALQRGPATARSTRRRSSAWSASCPTPSAPPRSASASREEGDAIALCGTVRSRRSPAPSWPSCAASRCRRRCPQVDFAAVKRGPGGRPRRRPRRRARLAPTTSPRAASLVAIAECCLAGGIGARLDLAAPAPLRRLERCSSARAPAASSSPGTREAIDAAGRAGADRRLRHGRRRRARDRGRRRAAHGSTAGGDASRGAAFG